MNQVCYVLMYLDSELYCESFWYSYSKCVTYAISQGFSKHNKEDDTYERVDGRDDYVTIVSLVHK